jgi:hypothetical protein
MSTRDKCKTNTEVKIRFPQDSIHNQDWAFLSPVKSTKRYAGLPIGTTARIAFEIDSTRAGCGKVAEMLLRDDPVDEAQLEECIRLDDALARAHRLLKATVRGIMMSRLKRGSRARGR